MSVHGEMHFSPFHYIVYLSMILYHFFFLSKIHIYAFRKKHITSIVCALLYIQKYDLRTFKKALSLKYILVHPKYAYDNEFFYSKKAWVCQAGTVQESSVSYLASLIVHEVHHLSQFTKGVRNISYRAEPGAYCAQIAFLRKTKQKKEADYVYKLFRKKFWLSNENVSKQNKKKNPSILFVFLRSVLRKQYSIKPYSGVI